MIERERATLDGLEATVVTLSNDRCKAVLTDVGARLVELHVPDRDGRLADVVLQRPTLEVMATDETYMGCTAGRCANRIRGGRLVLDGEPVQLSLNEGGNHLHGGLRGFDRHLWSTAVGTDADEVTFARVSPAGEEGYPGTMHASVRYRLEGSSLQVDIRATTDAPTLANIVHHSYFNLGGHDSGTVLDHLLEVRGSFYVPVDDDLLPTGEVLAVAGTPFDFRRPTPIGKNIAKVGRARTRPEGAGGYDHNWVLDGVGTREVVFLTDPDSGRTMTMSTNQRGVQLYAGGYLAGVTGKAPVSTYPAFAGLALEAQTFPDAVNVPHFPSAVLRPGESYHNLVRFDFGTV